jgi:hypothetical protein
MGWAVRGSNPGGGDTFAPLQPGPGVHSAYYTRGIESYLGLKRSGRNVNYPIPSNAEVIERLELTSNPPK